MPHIQISEKINEYMEFINDRFHILNTILFAQKLV